MLERAAVTVLPADPPPESDSTSAVQVSCFLEVLKKMGRSHFQCSRSVHVSRWRTDMGVSDGRSVGAVL